MSSVRGDVNTRMSVDITVTCTTLVSLTFNQMMMLLLLLLLLIFSANPRHASIHVSHDGAIQASSLLNLGLQRNLEN